jgi:hypothetical protein
MSANTCTFVCDDDACDGARCHIQEFATIVVEQRWPELRADHYAYVVDRLTQIISEETDKWLAYVERDFMADDRRALRQEAAS